MIARKTWHEVRGMGLAYLLILELMLVPAILLYPELRRAGSALVEIMPADFLKKMMQQVFDPDSGTAFRAYMAVQMFFKGVNIVGIAAAVLMGTGIVARERENQTLEFLLARPVSRSRILWGKFWPIALVVVVPVFLTSWTAIPISALEPVNEELPFAAVTICSLHNAAFCVLILAITTLCSVLARAQVHAAFWVGALVILQVALYFIQKIRIVSLFRLSDFEVYGPIMAGNDGFQSVFFGMTIWVLLATAVVYLIADRLFRRVTL